MIQIFILILILIGCSEKTNIIVKNGKKLTRCSNLKKISIDYASGFHFTWSMIIILYLFLIVIIKKNESNNNIIILTDLPIYFLSLQIFIFRNKLLKNMFTFSTIILHSYFIHKIMHVSNIPLLNLHVNIHHKIPKSKRKIKHTIIEILHNFFLICGVIYTFIPNIQKIFNKDIIIIWGLIYTLDHNIIMPLTNDIEHKYHHENIKYNYGPREMDYIFNTYKGNKKYAKSRHLQQILLFLIILFDSVKKYLIPKKLSIL